MMERRQNIIMAIPTDASQRDFSLKSGMHCRGLNRPVTSRAFDACAAVPIAAFVFALIVSPLLILASPAGDGLVNAIQNAVPRPENRIFWPAAAVISAVLAAQNRSRLSFPPHIVCLLGYLAFAGASVLWAFKPELSFIRFIQQVMVVTCIVFPTMLANRTVDMMRCLFLCFAFASIVNLCFVLGDGSQMIVTYGSMGKVSIGYVGYFSSKNPLGECAALTFLLSLHEMLYTGLRRSLGVIVFVIASLLVYLSQSKTALGLALLAPLLAGLTLIARKKTHISLAVILLSIPVCYAVLSSVSNFSMNRISYMLYGDSSFTGRSIIWDFAQYEISRRPLFGWGYQSFWLVGPDAPSMVEAPGWVKMMPNAHNGYYDTMLEIGYFGCALLVTFIIASLHAAGRVADRDPARGWVVLSLALYVIVYNYLESLWMRGFEVLWLVFLIVAAEIGRYWMPLPLARAANAALQTSNPDPLRGARRLRIPSRS
jgi:O-antigen ligase